MIWTAVPKELDGVSRKLAAGYEAPPSSIGSKNREMPRHFLSDVRYRPIPLKNSVLEPECHVIKQLEPRLFDKG